MFSRFRLLAKEAERDDLLQAATYHEAKVSANRGWNFSKESLNGYSQSRFCSRGDFVAC